MSGMRLPTKAEPEPRGLSDKERSRFEAVFQQPWLDRVTKRKRSEDIGKNILEEAVNRLTRDRAIVFLILYAGFAREKVSGKEELPSPYLRARLCRSGSSCATSWAWATIKVHRCS